MQLSELRKEMKFNKELLSLVGTLKSVAGSKYHMLEREKARFEQFMTAFTGFFKVVNLADTRHPLVRSANDILGIIAITSDSGFMGGLNAGIMEAVYRAQGERPADRTRLIMIGEKGASKLSDAGRQFKYFKGIENETRYEQALEVTDYVVKEVKEGRIGTLVLVYPNSLSFTRQVIETINVLPCAELFDKSVKNEVTEDFGGKAFVEAARKVVVESTFDDMVDYLARTWVASRLYEVFEDSKLSEFGARAMHLEGSEQKMEKELKKLQYRVFRASHEKIDKGMRESFSAGNIRKKKQKAVDRADAAQERAASLAVA
ncbi:MAG: F0F1 ATP synthase subunit gamma [bacterium]